MDRPIVIGKRRTELSELGVKILEGLVVVLVHVLKHLLVINFVLGWLLRDEHLLSQYCFVLYLLSQVGTGGFSSH